MAHLRFFKAYLLIIVFVFLSSCESNLQFQDQEDIQEPKLEQLKDKASKLGNGVLYSELDVVKQVESFKNELSNTYRNFGGVWFDNKNKEIVLSIKNTQNNLINQEAVNRLKTKIRDNFGENSVINSKYKFRIKEVQFSFEELQTYRDLLGPIIHQRDDIVESYIDSKENKFSIGMMEDAKKSDYENLIEQNLLPENAISFHTMEPYKISRNTTSLSNLQSSPTLRDRYRPLQGGLQIQYDIYQCTFGFNVKLDGEDMWVTNSHCSNTAFGNDNTQYYQNVVGSSNNLIGTEFRDIQPFGSGGGYRYSDAALIDLEEGVSTNFGAISNTNTYSTVWGTDGSIEMGSFYTYESIIGDGIQYLDGALIYKIGRSSGKTRGTVDATCVDASNVTGYPSGFTMRCQIRSSTYARGGDSGAPVYYSNLYFPQARLIGIHWGSSDEQQVSLHSPISAVKSELTQGSETMTTH